MRTTRKLAMLAVAACSVAGVTAIAQAATTQTLNASVSPGKAGTPKKPKGVKLTVGLATRTNAGEPIPASSRAVIELPKELRLNGKHFASCTLANAAKNSCPPGSRIGTGAAKANIAGQVADIPVIAFNGNKGKSLMLYLNITKPVVQQAALEGKLSGRTLTVDVPPALQQPVPGLFTPLTDFQVSIKASVTKRVKGKRTKINYVELIDCPASKKLSFKSTNTYADGSQGPTAPTPPALSATATSACS